MTLAYFAENLWIWGAAALFVLTIGGTVYSSNQRWSTLFWTVGFSAAVFVFGLFLYFFVDTDRKGIGRFLDGISAAIEANDRERVISFISPNAQETILLANVNLDLVEINSAQHFGFEIKEIQGTTAQIASVAVINGKFRDSSSLLAGYNGPFGPSRVEFRIEVEKSADGEWRVTDKCEFSPTATGIK